MLVVDDEADVRDVLGEYFEGLGYGVIGKPFDVERLRLIVEAAIAMGGR